MKIYLTTDTHFGHAKMKEYCGRPDGFENKILKNLEHLTSDDLLIHLGDFCIGDDERWHNIFNMKVRARKWLILGNHDHKSNEWYLNHGWDFVGAKFQDRLFGKNILFSHTPVRYDKFASGMWSSAAFDINIHGHFHNNLHRLQDGIFVVPGEKERNFIDLKNLTPRHKLLSIEYTHYQPVLLEKFI